MMSEKKVKEFDLVILGSSGLTGRYAVEELANSVTKFTEIKWAIAGRNVQRLKKTLEIVQEYLPDEINIKDKEIILADAGDTSSIYQMCKRTKLLLNCVGPYNLFEGEKIVSICIECKTHYIDISAEIKYLDSVLANYFEQSSRNGVFVIEACGYGSLPADYGITLLMKKFPGGLKSVEYYVELEDGSTGRPIGYGTLLSGVHSLRDYFKASEFEKVVEEKVFKKTSTKKKSPMRKRFNFRNSPMIYNFRESAWCLKYLGPDQRNIKRSQMIRANFLHGEEFIEAEGYLKFPSLFKTLRYAFVFLLTTFMCFFAPGKALLQKYPCFFTTGLFSKEGPSRQQVAESSTKITFYANGWKKKTTDFSDKQLIKPDTKIKLTITGPEAAYVLTAICMVQAGLTILKDSDKIPFKGGVYTPGVVFTDTSLQERLEKRGVKFTFEEIAEQ